MPLRPLPTADVPCALVLPIGLAHLFRYYTKWPSDPHQNTYRSHVRTVEADGACPMLLLSSRLPSRWFARPVILGIAAFLMLLATTGFLGIQDWHEWQAANRSVGHSRQVIETLDRVRAYIAELETEKRRYMLTPDLTYLNPYGASE